MATDDKSQHETLIHQWFRRIWNEGDLDAVQELMHPRNLSLGLVEDPVSRDSFKVVFEALNAMAEDIRVTVQDVYEVGDRIAGNWNLRIKHRATGKTFDFPGALFGVVEDGKFRECQNYFDYLYFFVQTGSLPENIWELCLDGQKASSYGLNLANATFSDIKRVWQADEGLFRSLFRTSASSLALVDPENKIVDFNRAFAQQFCFVEESSGSFNELIHPADVGDEQRLFAGLNPDKATEYHLEIRMVAGKTVRFSQLSTYGPLKTQDGLRYLRAVKDITTQRLEQLVRFQEQERRLLASDLHDSVAQDLAALSLKLQTALQLAEAPNGKLRNLLEETVGISQRLTGELSGLLSNLRSPVFEGLDLVEALENLIADNYADRWEVALAHRLDRQLSNSLVSMFAYRIVQEALQNARRHGKARRAEILLNIQNDRLKGRITDNGTGFDPSKPTKGTGISGMTERCELIGGRLSVKSSPGSGTTVLFELPV